MFRGFQCSHFVLQYNSGIVCWYSAGLVIKTLQVRILAEATGEFSSPEFTVYGDSHLVSILHCITAVAHKRHRSFHQKWRWQVTPEHAYTLDPTNSEWADYAVRETSSHKTCHGTLGHSHLSSLVKSGLVCVSWSPLNKNRRKMNCWTFKKKNTSQWGKSHQQLLKLITDHPNKRLSRPAFSWNLSLCVSMKMKPWPWITPLSRPLLLDF